MVYYKLDATLQSFLGIDSAERWSYITARVRGSRGGDGGVPHHHHEVLADAEPEGPPAALDDAVVGPVVVPEAAEAVEAAVESAVEAAIEDDGGAAFLCVCDTRHAGRRKVAEYPAGPRSLQR